MQRLVTKSEVPGRSAPAHPSGMDISAEAFLLAQLGSRRCIDALPAKGVVQFRGFMYLTGNTSTQTDGFQMLPTSHLQQSKPLYREWRTYMENCNFGNISRTMMLYKVWGYHVPESFIWWTFYWLLQGCRAMSTDTGEPFHKWVDESNTAPMEHCFMLSNDIKSDDCFLGPKRENYSLGEPFDNYPAARLGDFGLTQVKGIDGANRRRFWKVGTKLWTAPVSGQSTVDPSYGCFWLTATT